MVPARGRSQRSDERSGRLGGPMNRRRFVAGSSAAVVATLTGAGAWRGAMAQDGEPVRGGEAIIALIQEPGQMNPFFNVQSGAFLSTLVFEPLFVPDAGGEYIPVLAAEVPTLENGASRKTSRPLPASCATA